ncbi:ABC transporter permease [uncultured Gulosibacter sp.]|uniref:ABC transporter permease n=1 Tax=uncultured Gulosibacter sp. TaxID=1339167 RepID=UPI002888FA2E|nr:ABC transporter permease [uncultured Gulosibacter sp.]
MTTKRRPIKTRQPGEAERGARITGFVALIVDAWHELRVNRLRILLALIGITVAVIGLTGALGVGEITTSVTEQSIERSGGRSATVQVTGRHTPEQLDRLQRLPNDFGVTHHSLHAEAKGTAWTPSQKIPVDLAAIEPAYTTIFRQPISRGRVLQDSDADLLAPGVMVNEKLWQLLGEPDIASGATVDFRDGDRRQLFTIVGVVKPEFGEFDSPRAWFLFEQLQLMPGVKPDQLSVNLLMWVPREIGDQLAYQLNEQLSASGMNAVRLDWGEQAAQSTAVITWLVVGAAVGMFALGALGLVNINIVTMQQRVREIGIRRSYGATSARIFFGVLLESVVATFIAGIVGVTLTVIALQNPVTLGFFRDMGLLEPPPFPMVPALIGLASATVVGALAGALPALKATRVQIIDAIRY